MKSLIILILLPFLNFAQQKLSYKVAVVAFYNCENFYDTIHNPSIFDVDFTPKGDYKYSSTIYLDKVIKLATVIAQIGTDVSRDGIALIGVAEIENDTVLNDLIHSPSLINRNLKYVHYDSRDARGIDVALIYNPKYFVVEKSSPLFVALPNHSKYEKYTRDILWVTGNLVGERIHLLVNHWPSRLGGDKESEPNRIAAAAVCKIQIAEIERSEPNSKIIIMGDLNDDPINASVLKILNAKGNAEEVNKGGIYNPFWELYKKGIGTLAFNDSWSLFDQIMVNYPLMNKHQEGFFYYKQFIFNKEYMIENKGLYKGYPMRTWDGFNYRGGYSDHFPSYIVLLKKT